MDVRVGDILVMKKIIRAEQMNLMFFAPEWIFASGAESAAVR